MRESYDGMIEQFCLTWENNSFFQGKHPCIWFDWLPTWASGDVAIRKIRIVEHQTVLHLPAVDLFFFLFFYILHLPKQNWLENTSNGCSSLTFGIHLTQKRVELALCLHSISVFLSHQFLCFCSCVFFISFLPSFSFTIYLVILGGRHCFSLVQAVFNTGPGVVLEAYQYPPPS